MENTLFWNFWVHARNLKLKRTNLSLHADCNSKFWKITLLALRSFCNHVFYVRILRWSWSYPKFRFPFWLTRAVVKYTSRHVNSWPHNTWLAHRHLINVVGSEDDLTDLGVISRCLYLRWTAIEILPSTVHRGIVVLLFFSSRYS